MKFSIVLLIVLTLVGCGKCQSKATTAIAEEEAKKVVVPEGSSEACMSGKWPQLSNDAIINETAKCESAHMIAEAMRCNNDIVQIQCAPKPYESGGN